MPIQPWMNAPAVARVLAALGAPDVDVRFVGGAVRNAVMGLTVSEVDIATPDVPPRVIERLAAAGIKAVPTGLDHGTIMAVADGETFEITTLRRDTACDGRHAVVAFTTDWHEDARRRDFTMNAMSLAPDGTLFDDHGGMEDAKAGRVRFVGAPADRIQEDYLRILRLFRFFAWYGRVPLDDATLAACKIHAPAVARLSAERIQQEITRLLGASDPGAAVKLMNDVGLVPHVMAEAGDVASLASLLPLESAASALPNWLRRLAAMLPTDGADAAEKLAARLKLSNDDRAHLMDLAEATPPLDARTDPQSLRRALYHLGASLVTDRILLAWARDPASEPAPWRALLTVAAAWEPKTLPVGGTDVLALGITAGPEIGRLLTGLEEWWIGAGFTPGRTEALAQLGRLAVRK